ncbi:MAG: MarR family transcriptional regulator, partial [Actinomycetota bacterium]|nr:MarR family transcriptional regulator [Actinomycetota bacterium]
HHALRRVVAGEGDWLTRPLIDSYHTVWFELHQDLLDTLGIERGSEDRG